MVDPALLRDNIATLRTALQNRGVDLRAELEELTTLEAQRRRLLPELEGLKREQNAAGEEAARAKREGRDMTPIQEASRQRAQRIKQMDVELESIEERRNRGLLTIPNVPHSSVPVGKSAADNAEVRRHGEPKTLGISRPGALGPRARARHHRFRARHEDRRRAVYGARRRRRAPRARADQLHARPSHPRARLHRGRAAVHGQHGVADGNGESAEVRGRPVQDCRRLGPVPRADRGSAAHEHAPRRNSRRPHAADPLHRLYALFSQRSRVLRRRRARPDSAAPVRQGRADVVHDAGSVVRRARAADGQRRGSAEAAGAAVSGRCCCAPGDMGFRVGEDLRHRSVAAEPEHLPRDLVLQQHGGVPGAARQHQVPAGRGGKAGVCPHPERLRPRRRADADCDPGELPAEGWLGRRSPTRSARSWAART